MSDLDPPGERRCERCGRRDVWSDGHWSIDDAEGEPSVGNPYCLHEWDITASYNPFEA